MKGGLLWASIHENILDTIGSTPLVRINKLGSGKAVILAKIESFNPGGSIKDRIAKSMIEAAEKAGSYQSRDTDRRANQR